MLEQLFLESDQPVLLSMFKVSMSDHEGQPVNKQLQNVNKLNRYMSWLCISWMFQTLFDIRITIMIGRTVWCHPARFWFDTFIVDTFVASFTKTVIAQASYLQLKSEWVNQPLPHTISLLLCKYLGTFAFDTSVPISMFLWTILMWSTCIRFNTFSLDTQVPLFAS